MTTRLILSLVILCLLGSLKSVESEIEVEQISAIPKIVINPLGHSGKINEIMFSPNGEKLITVSNDKSIRLWDAAKGEELSSIHIEQGDGYEGMIYTADLSPDGTLLAVAGYPVENDQQENYVTLIDLDKNKQRSVGIGHLDVINAISFSSDGTILATGSSDGTVKVWRVGLSPQLRELGTLEVGDYVNDVGFSTTGYRLAVASDNSDIQIFDLRMASSGFAKTNSEKLKGHKGEVRVVEFSPDGTYLASAGIDNKIILWKSNGEQLMELDEMLYPVNTLTFSHDDKILVAMTDVDGKGRSYSLPNGTMFTEFTNHDNTVLSADFSPSSADGNYLVASAGGSNNEIIIWNAISGKQMTDLKGKGSIIWHARFAEGYKVFLSKTPIEKAAEQTYAITFDFANQVVGETVANVDFSDNGQNTAGYNLLGDYRIMNSRGGIIENDPNNDGRILSYTVIKDGGIIIGSDFSLKLYNNDGQVLKEFIGHTGGIRDVSISENEKYFISASEDQTVKLWDINASGSMISVWEYFNDPDFRDFLKDLNLEESARKMSYEGWEETIGKLESDGYKVVKDIAEVYQVLAELVKPSATLFVSDDLEYVCWTPEGYFSCSSRGAEYFGWHINNGLNELADFYTAEQYFDILYQPDMVAEAIKSFRTVTEILEEKGEKPFDLTKLKKPSAAFFNRPLPDEGQPPLKYKNRIFSTNAKRVTLTVDAYDGGGGIREISIYQNGKLIISDTDHKVINQDSTRLEYLVDLLNGPNLFKLVVKNIQGIESRPDNMEILYDGDVIATSDMYLFVVGINKYKNTKYNLNYAQPDANSFVEKIIERNTKLFRKIETIEIYDEQGTRENILAAFDTIKTKAKIHDVFVFYYAGHGSMLDPEDNNSEYFLVPHDVTQIYGDPEQLMAKGISSTQLNDQFLEIDAQKQLILLDACHSGGAIKSFQTRSASAEEKAIFQLARSAGVVVISASQSDQFATEFEVLQHGVFTYALLEALDGKADGGLKDGKVTVIELKAYMDERIPFLSATYGGETQYPTGFISGQDFPISILTE